MTHIDGFSKGRRQRIDHLKTFLKKEYLDKKCSKKKIKEYIIEACGELGI